MHKPTWLLPLLTGWIFSSLTPAALAVDPFTIVALPDTQNYVSSTTNAPLFSQQTQWIADQILLHGNPRNICFVTHLGDVVDNGGKSAQYKRADASMRIIDGVIPYGVVPGNHDYMTPGRKNTGTELYVTYFGPSRFQGQVWYRGSDPSGINSYQVFSAGGYEFIHMALEWRPNENTPERNPSPVEWAQSILDANPDKPVILSTHEHIDDKPAGRSGAGQALWDLLIRKNDQIFLVLNGHFHSVGGANDGEYHQVSINDAGRPVIEVLQDFQGYPNGGDGWLRLIQFDIDHNKLRFETYSPVLDLFQTETVDDVGGFASKFEFDVDYADRLSPIPIVSPFTELTFQEGVDNYAGTTDKEIRAPGDDAHNGQAPSISVDGDDGNPGSRPTQALIRFAEIFGDQPNQIPPHAAIESASLTLNITNPGSGLLVHQMLMVWTETTTWADLGGNGVTLGDEASDKPLAELGDNNSADNVNTGLVKLDITAAVRNWSAGQSNFGLALLPFTFGTNGVDFDSSEGAAPPILKVAVLARGNHLVTFQQGVNGYTGAVDTQIRQAAPNTAYAQAKSLSVDASDPDEQANHILIRFEKIFGQAANQIPTDRAINIIRAELLIHGTDSGSGGNLHRLRQAWKATSTWANSFSGDGVQADDTEAVRESDTVVPGGTGLVTIDVTASLKAWQSDPNTNLGWVILPRAGNGWDFDSSDSATPPQLKVYYSLADD